MAGMLALAIKNSGTFRQDLSDRAKSQPRDDRGRFISKEEMLDVLGIEPEDTELYMEPKDEELEEAGYDLEDALIAMIDAKRSGEMPDDEDEIETAEDDEEDDPLEAMAQEERRLSKRLREISKRRPTFENVLAEIEVTEQRNAVNSERRLAEYFLLNEEDTFHLDGPVQSTARVGEKTHLDESRHDPADGNRAADRRASRERRTMRKRRLTVKNSGLNEPTEEDFAGWEMDDLAAMHTPVQDDSWDDDHFDAADEWDDEPGYMEDEEYLDESLYRLNQYEAQRREAAAQILAVLLDELYRQLLLMQLTQIRNEILAEIEADRTIKETFRGPVHTAPRLGKMREQRARRRREDKRIAWELAA